VAGTQILMSDNTDLSILDDVKILMIDECHGLKKDNEINKILKFIKTNFKYGFTGTMPSTKIDEWNILSLGLSGADFYRDSRGNSNVATEHTAFANGKELFTFGEAIKFNNPKEIRSWRFNETLNLTNQKKVNYLSNNKTFNIFTFQISKCKKVN
jgi:hypothetical protein